MNSKKTEILLVEESMTQAMKLEYLLEQQGYDVSVTRSANDALAFINTRKPTLMISDVVLSDIDGYKLCQRIKADQRFQDIQVLLLIPLSDSQDILQGMESRADYFVVKPYEEESLLFQIQSILTNPALHKIAVSETGIECFFGGKKRVIPPDRIQVMNLLLSAYENGVQKTFEFERTKAELLTLQKTHSEIKEELQQTKRIADAADQTKNTFMATMSHEIRTPLNGVIGMTSLLLDDELSPQQKDYVETIRNSGDALLTILNDILDYSKIETGEIMLEMQSFNLRQCVEEAVDLFVLEAEKKGLELALMIDAHTPTAITGDFSRIRQILVNLLNNALKFTHQGEVAMSVKAKSLSSSPQTEDGEGGCYEIHFALRDTGIGIAKDRMDRLFKSFTQIDSSTTRQYGGIGLGLAMGKRLAELMGGAMWAESEEGKGSTFHFTIQANSAKAAPPVYLEKDHPVLEGKRVLIVDDNATNRQIMILQARTWNMHPVAASSGREALEYIRQGEPFDLAVLDMLMPEMDGVMLSKEIRRYRNDDELPLIMLSSVGREEVDSRLGHFSAFLNKPIKSSQLYNSIIDLFASEITEKIRQESEKKKQHPEFDHTLGERVALRVLLAEDSVTNQKLALHLLEKMGYRADLATNGLEAVDVVLRQPYDVVLMDMQMPEMDGLDATRRIRAEAPAERQPRIVALTANAMQRDREICLEASMDDYMTKPIRVEELTRVLQESHPLNVPGTLSHVVEDDQFPSWEGQGVKQHEAPEEPTPTPTNTVDLSNSSPNPLLLEKEGGSCSPSLRKRGGRGVSSERASLTSSQLNSTVLTPTPSQEGNLVVDPSVLDRLVEMTGDVSFVTELIGSFLTSAPQLLSDLRQGLEQGDAAKVRMASHTLKSSSADFGAMTLSKINKELEMIGKSGNLAGAEELIAKSEAEFQRAKPELEALQAGKTPEETPEETGDTYQGHILVVDDYPINRQKLTKLLEQRGHTVMTAENGKQAIDIINKNSLDLMLLDIIMPEMDGYQVLEHLKQHDILRRLPVIVVSALDEIDSVIKCIEMGAEDYLPKPFDPVLLKARIGASLEKKRLNDLEIERREELEELNKALEVRNEFIRKTFGRYLSDDIVNTILESPEGLILGGEKRIVTIMMTDLRGFTAISERLSPETVVSMLNIYLNIMTEITFKYQGTIDEFIGDAILAIFGAPLQRDDDAKRAVACALEMQLAMEEVNLINSKAGYPEVAMGIGINTGPVVVGNIGSKKRTKYGIVGRHVNLTSRIESYTVGGQIYMSEETRNACGSLLRIDSQMEVMPKGVKEPITIYEVGGIGGEFDVFLPEKEKMELIELQQPVTIEFIILEGKHASAQAHPGRIVKMAGNMAEIHTQRGCRTLTNLKISAFNDERIRITEDLYAKVTEVISETPAAFRINFTSVPPEAGEFFKKIRVLV